MFLQRDTIEEVIRAIQVKLDQANVERVSELPEPEQERLIDDLKQAIQKSGMANSL